MGKERGGIMVNDLKNEILTIIKKKITIIELNQHLSDLSEYFCLKEAFVLNRKLFQMIMLFGPPPDLASSIAYTCSRSTVNQQIWSFKGNHVHRAPDLDIFK